MTQPDWSSIRRPARAAHPPVIKRGGNHTQAQTAEQLVGLTFPDAPCAPTKPAVFGPCGPMPWWRRVVDNIFRNTR